MNYIKALILVVSVGLAQENGRCQLFDPDGAHVVLYFPQLLDGGSTERWQTSWVFTNPHETLPTRVNLIFVTNSGVQSTLDTDSGRRNQVTLEIPPRGTRTISTSGNSTALTDGYAVATSALPVQGLTRLRRLRSGAPQAETILSPVIPTSLYRSSSTGSTNLSLVNIQNAPLDITLTLLDEEGQEVSKRTITLNRLSRRVITTASLTTAPRTDFSGTVLAATDSTNTKFLAWGFNTDSSIVSSIPSGHQRWPVFHEDRAWLAYSKIFAAAVQLSKDFSNLRDFLFPAPEFEFVAEYQGQRLNAFANAERIIMTRGLSQLISDSDSEVAFVMGHEMGHVIQRRSGSLLFDSNPEIDADLWGFLLGLSAGYDPYAAAGALAKLAMATGRAGLIQQFEDQLSGDAHQSFNTRLQILMDSIRIGCEAAKDACSLYKSVFHPDLGPSAPLDSIKEDGRTGQFRSLLKEWTSRAR